VSKEEIILSAKKRDLTGKDAKKVRLEGEVPAVVYGRKHEPVDIQVEMNPLLKAIEAAGTHAPIKISLDGKGITAIIKSVERDVVSRLPLAVNFQAVSADEEVKTEVPIRIIDEEESPAKKAALLIIQDIDEIEVKAKPADLPEALEVSAKTLAGHGDRLHVKDLIVPKGVTILEEDTEKAIVSVWEPSAIAAQNAAADAAAEKEREATGEAAETPADGAETTDENTKDNKEEGKE
jgi:large subunit ribosomal protein L25